MTQEEIPLEAVETGLPCISFMTDLETCADKRTEEVKKNTSHDIMISSILL